MNLKRSLQALKQGDDVTFTSADMATQLLAAAAAQGIDVQSCTEHRGNYSVYVVFPV